MSALNDGFDQPQRISDIELAFPADVVRTLMPPEKSIPEDFRRGHGDAAPWVKFQSDWFFKGVSRASLTPRPDVDVDLALRHLGAIQGSWEPKHQHKQAAVAWLASRWFKAVAS